MTRITKEDVWRVASEIDAGGDKPSVLEVRKRLGSGSYTTITTALREWVKPDDDPLKLVDDLPAEITSRIQDFGREFFSLVKQLMVKEFEAEREAWSAERAELVAQVVEAGRVADMSESSVEDLNLQIYELRQEVAQRIADARMWELRYNDNLLAFERANMDAFSAREETARLRGRLDVFEKLDDRKRRVSPKVSGKPVSSGGTSPAADKEG